MQSVLEKLGIHAVNCGASSGGEHWIDESSDGTVELCTSYNPANGEAIASVMQASENAYNTVVEQAEGAFKVWRTIPAPQRGEVVRDIGNALRDLKEPLGELVSLEMGKIKIEGMGEV